MTNSTKSTRIPAIATNVVDDALTLTFSDGKQLTIRVGELTQEVGLEATLHGLKQKLVDAAAFSRNPATGLSATIEDKYAAVKEVYDRLVSGGPWNKVRDGGSVSSGGLLLAALIRMYEGKRTPESLRTYLEGKTNEDKASLRKNPKIAAIIEEIKAERAPTGGVDSDSLLDELDGLDGLDAEDGAENGFLVSMEAEEVAKKPKAAKAPKA